jgi:single-stranded-DNA-specific exonuclease
LKWEVAAKRDPVNATEFFTARRSDIPNPLAEIPECSLACERLRRAVTLMESILLYGDYDCDGVTSITLMLDALQALGASSGLVNYIIPHRLLDGYGLKWPKLEAFFKHEGEHGEPCYPDLLIAMDCGSNSPKEVKRLLDCGIDVIVIDHHHLSDTERLPQEKGLIHLNPGLWWDEKKKHTRFCAAGMTFFVADALHRNGQAPWNRERAILLAGLATCADVVPLLGVNRRLLKHSLSLARDPEKVCLVPGLEALKERMTIRGAFNEEAYSYAWGPCLNAPGRMGQADDSVVLLTAMDPKKAAKYACKCLRSNGWRKATERVILNSAMKQAKAQMADNPDRHIIFVCHPEWHPGVVGIVAARIRDRYDRPVFVSTSYGRGIWKGSARSTDACDLGKLLQRAKDKEEILEGGGHEMAGGLTFTEDRRHKLQHWLEENSNLNVEDLKPKIETAAPVSVLQPKDWAKVLKPLSPFGKENQCPALFVEAAELVGVRTRDAIDAASCKKVLIGYEGLFRERSTGWNFFALWRDYELADLLWEVHRFLDDPDLDEHDFVHLECDFMLDLELQGFLNAKERAKAERNRTALEALARSKARKDWEAILAANQFKTTEVPNSFGSKNQGGACKNWTTISAKDEDNVRLQRIEVSYNFVVRQCQRIPRKEPSKSISQLGIQPDMFSVEEMWGR